MSLRFGPAGPALAAFLLISGLGGPAAAFTAEDALDLSRSVLQLGLFAGPDGPAELTFDGDLGVAPAPNGGYVVTVPASRAILPDAETPTVGRRLLFGSQRLVLRHDPNSAYATVDWRLPETLRIERVRRDGDAVTVEDTVLDMVRDAPAPGSTDATLTVAADTGRILELDTALPALQGVVPGDGGSIGLALLAIDIDVVGLGNPVVDLPVTLAAEGMSLRGFDRSMSLVADTIGVSAALGGVEWDRAAALQQALIGLGQVSIGDPGRSPELQAALADSILAGEAWIERADASVTLRGLTLTVPVGTITVPDAETRVTVGQIDHPTLTAAAELAIDGFDVATPLLPPGLLPQTLVLSLLADGVPTEATERLVLALAQDNPTKRDTALDVLRQTTEASVTVNRLILSNAHVELVATGRLTPAPTSPYGVSGTVDATITGLPALLAALEADPMLHGFRTPVVTLQLLGQLTVAPDGTEMRTYAIDLGDAGEVMLNGAPMTGLLP